MRTLRALLAGLALAVTTIAAAPALPDTPAAAMALLYARRVTITAGLQFAHARGTGVEFAATMVVVAFDPALLYPRDSEEPVLYAGHALAHRANLGYPGGRLVVVIPGDIDLATTPIWLGTPALPEAIDLDRSARERQLADAAGIRAFPPDAVSAALGQGGEPLSVATFADLSPWLEGLVEAFAADERGETFSR